MRILIFRLGSERYAIPVEDARHLFLAVRVTPLPGSPSVVEGVVDVHGRLVPVYDLRRRFGLPDRELALEDHFILAWVEGREVLLHVEGVEGVEEVDAVEDPRALVPGAERIAGVARLADGLALIHDLETFLTEAEREALAAALAGARAEPGPRG